MKTGIVVLNYNDAEETVKFVNDINSYDVVNQIVVVDNGSTDDSLSQLEKIENIKLIALENNLGYAAGNNAGLKYLYRTEL